jgi:hypothetical protein
VRRSLSLRVTTKEQEFWDIFYKLRDLSHLTDKDLEDPIVSRHFKLMANMIYFYRHAGVEKVKAAVHKKKLAALGIPMLEPRRKK